jgi:addiction module HigA family antidote
MSKTSQSPGSFLAVVLEKYKLNPFKLSKDIHLSQSAVRMITIGKTKITTPVAMRLAKYFKTNPEFWLAMQMKWDIAEANKDKALMKIVKSITRVKKGTSSGGATRGEGKAAKKPGAKKKTARTRKPAGKKRAAGARKPVTRKKTTAAKKPVARKRAAKKPVTRKKAGVGKKRGRKPSVSRKKPVGRRGRPAKRK